MELKNKKFTIYPLVEGLKSDKADKLTNFTILKTKPHLGAEGERFVKKFNIIENADQRDEGIYCDVTFDVDELRAIHESYIELDVEDLADGATRRFPVPRLDNLLNDKILRKKIKETLKEKILDWVRVLKPGALFPDSTGELR